MKPTTTMCTTAFLLAFGATSAYAAAEASDPPRSNNRALVGAGASWITDSYDVAVNPGLMLGYEFGLGDQATIGLNADFSMMKNGFGTGTRTLIGADLKLLPASGDVFRPWLLVGGALASSSIDAGLGIGGGVGGYFGQSTGHSYFVDLRAYRIANMEYDSVTQGMVRLGVAF